MRTAAIAIILVALTYAKFAEAGPGLKVAAFKPGSQTSSDVETNLVGSHSAGAATAAAAAAAAVATPGFPVDVRDKQGATTNFTVGSCTGNGFCFPEYIAANVQEPKDVCEQGFNINATGLGQTMCVKKVYREVPSCFRSTNCPAAMENVKSEELCFSPDVRGALVGMLTVFKVHATLPFKLLPALKSALVKAAKLPAQIASDVSVQVLKTPNLDKDKRFKMPSIPEVTVTLQKPELQLPRWDLPDIKLRSLMRQTATLASAGQDVAEALARGKDPMDILTNTMMNINISEFMSVMPQIDAWVSEKLQGLTNINEVTAEVSSKFPDCLYRCCTTDVVIDTSIALATRACPDGLKLNSLLNRCVSESGYASCPLGMIRCEMPVGQPVCVVESNSFGLDSCKLAVLLAPALPKHQCPLSTASP